MISIIVAKLKGLAVLNALIEENKKITECVINALLKI